MRLILNININSLLTNDICLCNISEIEMIYFGLSRQNQLNASSPIEASVSIDLDFAVIVHL